MDVTATSTLTPDSGIDRIFGPVVERRTYLNLLYGLVAFPWGLMTFVMMIVGLATGVGLAIIVVGFVILALTLALARVFAAVERALAGSLLGASFDTSRPRVDLRAGLSDARSWTSAAYFILRFPLVVMHFVASVLMLASITLLAAPLLYNVFPLMVAGERVTSSEEAILVSLIGCVLFLLCVHAVNALAAGARRLAVALL